MFGHALGHLLGRRRRFLRSLRPGESHARRRQHEHALARLAARVPHLPAGTRFVFDTVRQFGPGAAERVVGFWKKLGARILVMSPKALQALTFG